GFATRPRQAPGQARAPALHSLQSLGEEFREMKDAGGITLSVQTTAQVHDAARVVCDHGASVRCGDVLELTAKDSLGDLGEIDRKAAAETAADLRFLHLRNLDAERVLQDAPGLGFQSQAVEALAGVVAGDGVKRRRLPYILLDGLP